MKTSEMLWQMFTDTGNISYYLMYKRLGEDGRESKSGGIKKR